jgi:hypothetical protein
MGSLNPLFHHKRKANTIQFGVLLSALGVFALLYFPLKSTQDNRNSI